MKKHIGWVKFCRTSTTLDTEEDAIFVDPWPCYSVFHLEKPEIPKDEKWQFFYKKMYVKDNF